MHRKFTLGVTVGSIALAAGCSEPPVESTAKATAFPTSGAAAPEVTVTQGGPCPCTIQAGVDLVDPGGRVLVNPGTYVDTVVIDKGLTLEAIGDGPVIVAPDPGAGSAIRVTATDPVVIRGLTIDCCVAGSAIRGQGLVNLTIEEAIVLRASIGAEVSNTAASTGGRARLVVRNSTFDGGSPPTMLVSVFAFSDVDALIEGNVVRRTTFSCIQPQGTANANIIGNDVDECGPNGGIRAPMTGPAPVVNIIRNTVRNSSASTSQFGIQLSNGNGFIERNTVVNYVQPSAPVGAAGIEVANSDTAVVRFNEISGNAQAGLRVSGTPGAITATCNWWGSADGPSGVGPGSGDAVIGPATVVPFATAPRPSLKLTCR